MQHMGVFRWRKVWLWVMLIAGLATAAGGALHVSPVQAASGQDQVRTGASSSAELESYQSDDQNEDETPTNFVQVTNHTDQRLKFRGHVQINGFEGPSADATNEASAYSSCVGCTTIAVALQLDLVSPRTSQIVAKNYAIAVNDHCTGCVTIAVAIQYVVTWSDRHRGLSSMEHQAQWMNRAFQAISRDRDISVADAAARANNVIAQFVSLADGVSAPVGGPASPRASTARANTALPGGLSLMPPLAGNPYVAVASADQPNAQVRRP